MAVDKVGMFRVGDLAYMSADKLSLTIFMK